MYRLLFILLICVGWLCTNAQILPSKRYTTVDGLVSDRITCMIQDEQGFIWAGSFFGLSRYDGYRFVNIPLPPLLQNKYVTSLAATNDAVYAGFLFGGGLMEYRNGKVTTYTVPGYKGQSFNDVLTLSPHTEKGLLVCGYGNEVYHFTDGSFKFLFELDSNYLDIDYRFLAMDLTGNIWIATNKGLALFTKNGKLIRVTNAPAFALQTSGKGVTMVSYRNGNGILSFAELDNGNLKIKDQGSANSIYVVDQNNFQKDHTWLLDTSGRLINMTTDGQSTSYRTKDISSKDVYFLYSDRENNLWIGTHTGLVKMPNMPSGFYPYEELADAAGNIVGNDSILWINNGKHLYVYHHDDLKKVNQVKITGALCYSDNQLWAGNDEKGMCRVQLKNEKVLSVRYFKLFGKTKIKVHTITTDANGDIWACGRNGIFYFKNGIPAAHFIPLLKNGEPSFIVCIVVDSKKQIIWAGDNAGGVLKIHYGISGNGIRYQLIKYIDNDLGLTDTFIRSMLLDSKGTIWVGTRFGGVFRILDKNHQIQVQHISSDAGMACTRVTDIKEVAGKSIWISSCNGIYQYQYQTGKWKAYTTADGLHQAEVFASYISADEKRCWTVSATGVTTLQLIAKKQIPPPLVNLIRITVLGKDDSAAIYREHISVYEPNESSIGFQFAAASYTDEKKIWYKYRLEGYDPDWSTPIQSNSVNYASVPPGTYNFKVAASVDKNTWSETPAAFSFTIRKPFYKSPLFYLFLVAIVIGSFYVFYTYRLQQKLKLERMRSRISADLHDDIGSTLSSISIISEGAWQENDVSVSKQMMKQINENTQMLMDKMDDIIWYVNPQNDSFENLMLRIQKFSSMLFEAKGIDYNISIDKRINDISLAMNQRQHLYLILKESVNNLVKYSGCTQADIEIHYEAGYLDIKVADNGKGFDVSKQQNGNGLRNMKRRADLLHASLTIDSSRNGTIVHLRTKIK